MVTFYNMTEETYDMLNPGDRISIVGAFLGKSKFNADTLQLVFRKGSQIRQIAKSFEEEMQGKYKSVMYCQSARIDSLIS